MHRSEHTYLSNAFGGRPRAGKNGCCLTYSMARRMALGRVDAITKLTSGSSCHMLDAKQVHALHPHTFSLVDLLHLHRLRSQNLSKRLGKAE